MIKSPKEIIESIEDPQNEHLFFKFPGKEIIDISADIKKRSPNTAYLDWDKYFNEREKRAIERYGEWRDIDFTTIHTHPLPAIPEWSGAPYAIPSAGDISDFLSNPKMKKMVIAQTNAKNGKLMGYFIMRKKKGGKLYPSREIKIAKICEEAERYQARVTPDWHERTMWGKNIPKEELDKLAKFYNFQFGWHPAKGYVLSDETLGSQWCFVKEGIFGKKNLETVVKINAIILVIVGLSLLSYYGITGKSIANLSMTSNNLIGITLLLIGFMTGFFILIKKKSKK